MIELNLAEMSQHLRKLLNKVDINAYSDFETFFAQATLAAHEFPAFARAGIDTFARKSDIDGALMLRGLPTDENLPLNPSYTQEMEGRTSQCAEFWMCCIASLLGEPVGYAQEKNGALFQSIYPTFENADKLSSESSLITLNFHTEMAFHPYMPDYVLLYGIRQDPDKTAMNSISGNRRITEYLSPEDQEILFSPLFRTGIDYSFGSQNGTQGNGPRLSIFYGDPRDPFLRYDLELMVSLTPDAQRASQNLERIIHQVKTEVAIEPGTLLVLDNRYCVHARSHFKAYYNNQDRWLLRLLVTRDLEKSFHDRELGSRVIKTDFSHYLTQ